MPEPRNSPASDPPAGGAPQRPGLAVLLILLYALLFLAGLLLFREQSPLFHGRPPQPARPAANGGLPS